MLLNDILGKPKIVEGIGEVKPIRLTQYEEFMQHARLLMMTKNHFNEEVQDYPLFSLIITSAIQYEAIEDFIRLLHMVTDKEFELEVPNGDEYVFKSGKSMLNSENFDAFRDTVMKQNLLYEDKVFKDPMVKKWADKVLEARGKDAVDMSLEDIVSVVHLFSGASYSDISEYTMYQLRHTFQRIIKVEEHNQAIQFLSSGMGDGKIKPEPYMGKIEVYKDPYEDVFVDKGKLNNLNKAL